MKVLFLDIDGVINSERTRTALKGYPHNFDAEDMAKFDHVAIELIRRVCVLTGANVVMSSSWRSDFARGEFAAALELPVISKTVELEGYDIRGEEIKCWLEAHPEVTRYAIVDDVPQMLEEQQEFFVLTNPDDGLSFANYRQLLNILGVLYPS